MRHAALKAVLIGLACASVASGRSFYTPMGPPAALSLSTDDRLFELFVVPPKASGGYKPGQIKIYLKREHPDYMLVELPQCVETDGRLRAQFDINPKRTERYLIRVTDLQPNGEILLLNETPLRHIDRINSK